jgi:glycosyltransferase involved in cell wall biosynthesis
VPIVSVVIPTFNRSSLLSRAIASALGQTVRDIEVIVCDDGSNDDTPDVVASITDGRLVYLSLDHSGLPAVARNAGIEVASGRYIAFLDSDDAWDPRKLAVQLAVLERDTGAVACCTDVGPPRQNSRRLPRLSRLRFRQLVRHNTICTSTMLIDSGVMRILVGFDPAIGDYGEDYDLWLRILDRHDGGILHVHSCLVDYSRSEGSLSSPYRNRRNPVERLRRFRSVYARFSARPSARRRLRRVDRALRALQLKNSGHMPLAAQLSSRIGPLWIIRLIRHRLTIDSEPRDGK